MSKIPQPFWAIVLAFLGSVIGLCVLYHQGGENAVNMGVLGIAASLISGSLGAFAGHASANNKTDVTAVNASTNISPDA